MVAVTVEEDVEEDVEEEDVEEAVEEEDVESDAIGGVGGEADIEASTSSVACAEIAC